MTDTIIHGLTVEYLDDDPDGQQYRRVCPCGYRSIAWQTRFHPNPKADPDGCPRDPTVRGLVTLQFSWGGLFDGRPADGYNICLVRSTNNGTPGPTLCGVDRFAKGTPGWSLGGGIYGPGIVCTPCAGCVEVAATQFPGLPIREPAGVGVRAAVALAESAVR